MSEAWSLKEIENNPEAFEKKVKTSLKKNENDREKSSGAIFDSYINKVVFFVLEDKQYIQSLEKKEDLAKKKLCHKQKDILELKKK